MSREQADTKEYVSILADGTFRLPVPEGTEGAVKREWEVDDKSGVKNELVFRALMGYVTNVDLVDTEFGTLIQVDITDKEGTLTISTGVNNNFGSDLLKKLPNLDPAKEYRFAPWTMDKENGKTAKGVSITEGGQKELKVGNFFYDEEKKEEINGMPTPDESIKELEGKKRSNAWKKYFMDVEEFLVDYAKENLVEKFNTKTVDEIFDEITKDEEEAF